MRRADFPAGGPFDVHMLIDPEFKARLVREAHRARNEAMGRAFASLAHAIAAKLRRALRIARVVVLRAGQHANAALGHAEPR